MRKFVFIFIYLMLSCSSLRKPASVQQPLLIERLSGWTHSAWSSENCSSHFEQIQNFLSDYKTQQPFLSFTAEEWLTFQSLVFQFHAQSMTSTPADCVLKLRAIYSQLRAYQDWTGEKLFEKSLPFAVGLHGEHIDVQSFPYRTGDILLTRGNTFLSSTISHISTNHHHYSHVAYVYVDDNTGKAFTLESYPTKGAQIYPMDVALKNENARILLLRPKDAEKAAQAVNFMFAKISKSMNDHQPIDYDYLYDENDHSRLSCVEVVQEAYALTSKEIVPALKSQITNRNQNFLKSVGLHNGLFFVPGDLETDPRFELIYEWTDYRQTADQRIKDGIAQKIFQWTSEENYEFQATLKSLASRLVLSFRHQPAVWNMLSTNLGMQHVPLGIPGKILTSMVKMNDVGSILLGILKTEDNHQMKTKGRHLTEIEIAQILDNFKNEDKESFLSGRFAPLHFLFRPSNLQPGHDY